MAEVQTKTVEAMTVLSLSFTGAYSQTIDRLDDLLAWVLRAGHPWAGPPVGIYYDDPAKAPEDKLRGEVVVPIAEVCKPTDNVQRKELPGALVACAVHDGPYSDLPALYKEIFDWITQNGYRYVEGMGTREVFHKFPGMAGEAQEYLTEVQVPIEKV